MKLLQILFILFLYLLPNTVFSQITWTIQERKDSNSIYKIIYQKNSKDSLAYQNWLKQYLASKTENGYIELQTTQTKKSEKQNFTVFITLGTRNTWLQIGKGNLPTKQERWKNKPFSLQTITQYQQKILHYAETIGHPFAQIRLDSLQVQAGKWQAIWAYQPRLYVTFDSVAVVGKVKTNARFLRQYLRLQIGQPYNHTKIEAIKTRLQRLPYLRLDQPPEVRFMQDKAIVLLTLSNPKANQIDGILGVLPNENRRGQLLLTGELNGQFYNLFAQGHSFKIQWQRLQTQSQRLEMETNFQTIFNTPLQFQAGFKLLKQDSTFVNQQWELRLGYATQGSSDFFAQILHQKTNLGNAINLYENKQLPNISETKWQGYGFGYKVQTLDDVFFPKTGIQLHFSVYTGVKQIIRNPFLPDTLYKDLALNTPQTLTRIEAQGYFSVGKGVFKLGVQGAYLANKQLFTNELMRVGGLTSLRGHNQNAFFASQYLITTVEYRLPLDVGSYVFVFYDQAYLESRILRDFTADSPAGIGFGANLSLKAGVFSLAYALGKDKTNGFSFSRSKIHFGVVSRF